jgi:hypothetical protein
MTYLAGDAYGKPLALRASSALDRGGLVPLVVEPWPGMPRTYRRVTTCAAADLLAKAAAILRDHPTVAAYMLAANRAAEVLGALQHGADQLDAPFPASAKDTADDLRLWALTVKQPARPRGRAAVVREPLPAAEARQRHSDHRDRTD